MRHDLVCVSDWLSQDAPQHNVNNLKVEHTP